MANRADQSTRACREQAARTHARRQSAGRRARPGHLDAARMLFGQMMSNPGIAAQQYLSFLGELGRIAAGGSELAPDAKDKRFADPAWKESVAYRALAQCYLAWGSALHGFVDEATMDKRDAERARFVVSLLDRRDVADQHACRQSRGAEEVRRHRRREPRCTAWRISSATSRATAACRRRSTRASSPSAGTSPRRRARSSTATR